MIVDILYLYNFNTTCINTWIYMFKPSKDENNVLIWSTAMFAFDRLPIHKENLLKFHNYTMNFSDMLRTC